MNEEAIAKQNEYLMALFGVVRRENGKRPIMNGDSKQEEMYAQNMSHLARFCSSSELSDNEILQFFSGSTMPFVNILVQLLYGLSFSSFSEAFTDQMNVLTREYMTRLLYTDDCRLVSFLLLDCKILIEDLVFIQNQYASHEVIPDCFLHCFFNVAQQISTLYGSVNSQSESYSCTGNHELFVLYDCSKGETRQSLLNNTVSLMCSLLSKCHSFALFTSSILSYYPLAQTLLQDYSTIAVAVEFVTTFIQIAPSSLSSLQLIQATFLSINNHLTEPSECGNATAIATLSDELFSSFIHSVIRCLQSIRSTHSLLFPFDLLFCSLSDFLSHFPYSSRPSLIPCLISFVSYLHSIDALSDSFCIKIIIQNASIPPSPSLAEVFSDLLFDIVNHDYQQFFSYLEMSGVCQIRSHESKQPRIDLSTQSFEISENTTLFQFYSLLHLYNKCILHLNHNQQPYYASSFIQFMQVIKRNLIRYIDKVILPNQLLQSDSGIPTLLGYTHIQLCICVEICLCQLLETEDSLRKRLLQFIERWTETLQSKESHSAETKENPIVLFFDGSANGLKQISICLRDYQKNHTESISLSSLEEEDLIMILHCLRYSLLNPTDMIDNEEMEQFTTRFLKLRRLSHINAFSVLPLALYSILYHVQSLKLLSQFLSSCIHDAVESQDCYSLQTLLWSVQYFSCSLSKMINFSSCYFCLNQDMHSKYGDFPNYSFATSDNTCLDMNELYFTLFFSIHPLIIPFFSQHILQSKDSTNALNNELVSLFSSYLVTLSSIIHHSTRFLKFVIDQQGDPLIRSIQGDQDEEETRTKIQNSWLFMNLGKLREFLQTFVFSISSLYDKHTTSVLLFLLSLISVDLVFDGYLEDTSHSLLQYPSFTPLIKLIDSIESLLKGSHTREEYNQLVVAYGSVFHGILSVIYSVSINLLLHPFQKPLLSLLIIQLFKWINNNDDNIVYDLCLQHLIRLTRYSLIIHRKVLWVVLPECIVAEIVKSMIALPEPKQQAILSSAFDPSISLQDWYEHLAIYVLPVFVYQQEMTSIVTLAKAIHPDQSVSLTISSLFQGDRCVYNVLVYLLKHMLTDSMKSWKLFFFLQSDFQDEDIQSFSLETPSSSKVSINRIIQQEGHRILWPLLFDCTDTILHDRQMSEMALKSLYDLYEEDGDNKRSGLFSKSFHYFTFQINQALSFNTYDLKRAIFALKRSLEDFKEFSQQDQMKLPEHFLWGVLSFIKSILQRPELQLHAFILLHSFLDTLSESMLSRVLSEIIVCVSASFEKCSQWLKKTPQTHIEFNHGSLEEFKKVAIERESASSLAKPTQERTIDSFFLQKTVEPTEVVMTVYGEEKNQKRVSSQKSWAFPGQCCTFSPVAHVYDNLYSFESNGDATEMIDIAKYVEDTSAYFTETLRHISSQHPKLFEELLQQRPYLFFLRFGDYSLYDVVNRDVPSSLLSFTVTTDQLISLFQLICNIPELSLEIVPAMGYASLLLKNSQKVFQQWIAPMTAIPSIVQQFYYYCIRLSSVAVTNHSHHTQLLIGEVLGLLGAIAPERFESQVHEDTVQLHLTDFELALTMIKRFFVKDLMGLPKREIQNRLALTVQRLLRFLYEKLCSCRIEDLTADSRIRSLFRKEQEKKENSTVEGDYFPERLRLLFSEEELSVISQYWKTEYSIRKEGSDHTKGFEGISVKNYAKWITKCSFRLISLCPKEEEPSTQPLETQSGRSSTLDVNSASSTNELKAIQSNDSVVYVFRTLLTPLCADRVSFLFPHIIQFALFYHYKHYNDSGAESPQNLVSPFISSFASYCNDLLHRCDITSDNEVQHCCSDLLGALNTLEAWSRKYRLLSIRNPKTTYKTKSEIIDAFLSQLDHRQIIRVAKILGQYERALKELEEFIRVNHSVTTGKVQNHITTVCNTIDRGEVDELLMLYYKLQNQDMTKGYETLLERNHGEVSLFHLARDLEMKSQYDIATRNYREVIQKYQDKAEYQEIVEEATSGYYRCLQSCGNWKDVLTTQTNSGASLLQSSQLLYWKMEGCWRESEWSLLRKQIEEFEWLWKNQHEKSEVEDQSSERWLFSERELDDRQFDFSYFLSKLLLAHHDRDPTGVRNIIDRSRYAVIRSLSFHPNSSIQSVYPHLLHLHIIQDLESGYSSIQKEVPYMTEFNKRLQNTSRRFEHRELILATRKAVVEQTKQLNQVHSVWLQIASLALESHIPPAVWIPLSNLQDSEGHVQVIRARLYDELGYTTNAINILHSDTNELKEIQKQKLENLVRIKRRTEPYDVSIQNDYQRLLDLGGDASEIHYNWGKLHDSIYSSQNSNVMDLEEAVRHYCLSLQVSDSFLYHCIIRLTTLWFRIMQEPGMDLMGKVPEIKKIKNYQWYTVLQQLVAVAQHPCDLLKSQVGKIVKHVLSQFTEHVVWQIIGMMHVEGSKKKFIQPVDIIYSDELHTDQKRKVLETAYQVSGLLIKLSTSAVVDQEMIQKINTRLASCPMILPIQQYLHSGINSFSISDDMNMVRLSTKVEIFSSKEKPKKVTFRNRRIQEFFFLCKQEKRGDLRKDLRMMEYVSIVNHVLASDSEGQVKHLQLNTFCVTCLNEKSGLIEWVRNSEPTLSKLNTLRALHGLQSCSKVALDLIPDFDRMQTLLKSGQKDIGLKLYFNTIMSQFKPVLHEWLLNDFPDPRQWLQARELFTQSTAIWSMTGYMIGLGDRHNDNILIQKNGAVSHIDFDCIFEKGTTLKVPECVPFRLTPNIIDAFGISGIEGTFRSTCEVVIRCMRSNHDLVISVLESLLYDPLIDWRTINSDGNECGTDVFKVILKVVENRLRGIYGEKMIVKPKRQSVNRVDEEMMNAGRLTELSVQGQVDNVIKDATNTYNLARMYIGWMPFI